jgi:hypothetical protein
VELGEGSESFQAYFIHAIKNNIGTWVLRLTDVYGHQHNPTRDFVCRFACCGYKRALLEIFSPFLLVELCLARASGNICVLCYLLYYTMLFCRFKAWQLVVHKTWSSKYGYLVSNMLTGDEK